MEELELSEEKIQKVIVEILSGQRLVKLDGKENHPSIIRLLYPSASDRQYCDIIEENSVEKAIEEGLPSEDSLDDNMSLAFFSTQDMEDLQDLKTKREGFQKLLKKRIKGTDLYFKDEEKLKKLEEEISSLEQKRNQMKEFTAEYQAKEDKYFELLVRSAHHMDGYRIWDDASHFLNTTDVYYAYALLNKFLDFYWGYDTRVIRYIARSSQWRTMYLSAEKGARLTDLPAKDLPVAYLHLMSWSMFYQSIYEMIPSDRPSEDIIQDDEKLDKFMQEYQIKVRKEAEKNRKGNSSSKSSATDKDQVVVTAESSNYVNLHKKGEYSDTAIISGRVSEDLPGDTSYSEIREHKIKSRERAAKRRKRLRGKK